MQLHEIAHNYDNDGVITAALDGVSLTIDCGEFVCVSGDSGAGKTTLMRVLGCLLRASHGRYFFAGHDVAAIRQRYLARIRCKDIGFVFQEPALLENASAQENVEVPAAYNGVRYAKRLARVRQLLAEVGLGGRLDHRPSELSVGEQQKVSLARALINNPQLVLADEPTGSLDPRASDEVMSLLGRQAELGRAVVVVSHQESVANRAQRRVKLDDGCLVDDRVEDRRT